jgi:ribosomal protein L39E
MPKKVRKSYQKKIKLTIATKRTKWAPVWVIVKKFGPGKRVHPSSITRLKRNWRRTKLKIKPRSTPRRHLG